jgi:rhodanese-related sulfurtransferase
MDQVLEFVGNHMLLSIALIIIIAMIVKAELDRLIGGVVQVNAFDAIRQINDQDAVMLDVREMKEFKDGHLKDAVHIPLGEIKNRLTELDKHKNKPILVYCRSGQRSYSACKTLKKAGFESVSNLQGGIMAWQSQNMPVSKA